MNNYTFILLLCIFAVLDAGTLESVWLRDLNNDAHKRHLDAGLSAELRFQLNRGNDSINIHLRENPNIRGDTDMFVVQSMPDGTNRAVKETFTEKIESKYYHDMDNSAFFTVRCVKRAKDPCARILEGSLRIGDKDFHIAPVSDLNNTDSFYMNIETHGTPHFLQEHWVNGGNNSNSDEDIDLNNDYKIAPDDTEEENIRENLFAWLRRSLDNLNPEERALDKNKRAPIVYGVELLVAVDPPIWQKFNALTKGNTNNAMNRVREYVSQVINGVDLRYKTIRGRSFSISITLKTIIVVKFNSRGERGNFVFLYHHYLGLEHRISYNAAKTEDDALFTNVKVDPYLKNFGQWVLNTPGMPSRSDYDHAMMITGYRMTDASGAGYEGGVCGDSGVSLVSEAGYFWTMIVASHELAHNLGALHDDKAGCDKGYIMWMTDPVHDNYNHKAWEFSKCSIDSFEKLLATKSCVLDEATFYDKQEYDYHNRDYPGQIYGPDEQCKLAYGEQSYKCSSNMNPKDICLYMTCHDPISMDCTSQIPADGTPCGRKNTWCIDGLCVSKPSGVTTPKTTTTATTWTNTPTTSLTSAPTSKSSTEPPSCIDIIPHLCKEMYDVYNDREKFCSEVGDTCCETCKEKPRCEDTFNVVKSGHHID